MIDGINVIDAVQVRNMPLTAMIALTLVMILILLLNSILLYFLTKGQKILRTVCGLAIIGTVILTCYIWTDWTINGRQYHTEYKVILEDDLRYNDFVERYEILNQDGKIYTIKERD